MRIWGVALVLLCGCGLVLDLDPPEMDAGARADSGASDVPRADGASPDGGVGDAASLDGALPDVVDAGVEDAGFGDTGFMCVGDIDCAGLSMDCTYTCFGGRCVEVDDNGDGVCDPPPECMTEGAVNYSTIDDSCATRSLTMCVEGATEPHVFPEVEACGGGSEDCDAEFDEFPDFEFECGVGECVRDGVCGECVGGGTGIDDGCTVGDTLGLDDDCDGRVDEDCAEVDCIGVTAGELPPLIAGRAYCLDVEDCTAPVEFFVPGATLSEVRIYGDMQLIPDTDTYVPCPTADRFAPPRAHVVLGGPLEIDGPVQISNVSFQPSPAAPGTTIHVTPDGTLRGDHIHMDGGNATALRVDAEGEATLSDASITSSSPSHTINSEGSLVLESSCPNGPLRGRCTSLMDETLTGAITKTRGGNSVIHLSGIDASLRMTSVRVVGPLSTAIWAVGVGTIEVSDSVIIARPAPLPGPGPGPGPGPDRERHETVALEGCTRATFRDTIIRNVGDSSSDFPHYGVHARGCSTRFSAPNVALRPHIVGTTVASANAVGVSCGDTCSFEQISVAGFGVAATPNAMLPDSSEALGLECGTGCTVVDSTIRGNAGARRAGSATGLRIADGTVLRSRIGAGAAAAATGLQTANAGGRDVHVQDSLVVGYIGTATGPAIEVIEARGVLVDAAANFSALHSTFAARSMTRLPVTAACHAVEALRGAEIRLVSSALWAPCMDGGYSYYGGADNVVLMDHVGVDMEGFTFLDGSALLNSVAPFPYLLVRDPPFADDYSGAILPRGAPGMITERDVDGAFRGATSGIGAYNN